MSPRAMRLAGIRRPNVDFQRRCNPARESGVADQLLLPISCGRFGMHSSSSLHGGDRRPMTLINEHYLKLQAGYLFPEIARRVESFKAQHPDLAGRVISCGIGDVTEPLPPAVIAAMHRAVDDMSRRQTFRGYGPATGYAFLRDAIAQHDFRARGIDIAPDEIFISDGSKVDCSAILDILATGKPDRSGGGNRIALPDPVYPVYVDSNVMVGNTGTHQQGAYEGLTYLPCTQENGFVPDTPREPVDVIYLCFPNNPTGSMINRKQLAAWVEYAREHDAIILYDAAYDAYVNDASLPRSIFEIDGARECAIEFHSFSKNGGFTGVRCGFTVCPKSLTGRTRDGTRVSLHGLWTRRWSTKSNGVSYIVQRGAEALFSPEGRAQVGELIQHYRENARILRDASRSMGLSVFGGVHAPYVWVACRDNLTSWQMFDRMLSESQIVITPGSGFGRCGEGFFRISAFNTRENITEVVSRMKSLSMQPA